ncbi:hypothetical protein [uncultured Microscilla sp.]|uniref:hypothetical protein n=1 Tax=uncultured Microscilla sp. TaxID=432653 RepID=UPI0026139156|nr:hypothetical protein [uncultured Microscilla sp.]
MKRFYSIAIICLLFISFFSDDAEAQRRRRRGAYYNSSEFMYSLGATAVMPRYTDEFLKDSAEEYFGLTFSPRLNLIMGNEQSMSLALYMSLLYGEYLNKKGETKDLSYEIPFVINFNFGAGATHSAQSSLGGFLGLGYQFSNLYLLNPELFGQLLTNPNASPDDFGDIVSPMEGFYLNAGFRFAVGSGTGNIHAFMVNTKIENQKTYGLRFMYTFGDGRRY